MPGDLRANRDRDGGVGRGNPDATEAARRVRPTSALAFWRSASAWPMLLVGDRAVHLELVVTVDRLLRDHQVLLRLLRVGLQLSDLRRAQLDERLPELHVIAELDEDRRRAPVDRSGHALGRVFIERDSSRKRHVRGSVARLELLDLDELERRIRRLERHALVGRLRSDAGLGRPFTAIRTPRSRETGDDDGG